MKRMKYVFGIMALVILTAIGANAQQTVTQGSTHHYHVTDNSAAGYGYNWTIAIPSAGNTVESATTAATNITWGDAGNYTITLTETNTQGSCATPNTFTVQVLGAPHLQFTAITSANCADQAMDIALTFTQAGNVLYYPLVVNYTVNGVARVATFTNATDALVISLTLADRADLVVYNSFYTIPVIITGATSNGGSVVLDANTTHTNTVYDVPELNPIVAD
jgi:hypothetical protein